MERSFSTQHHAGQNVKPTRRHAVTHFQNIKDRKKLVGEKGEVESSWKSIGAAQNQAAIQQSGSRGAVGAVSRRGGNEDPGEG